MRYSLFECLIERAISIAGIFMILNSLLDIGCLLRDDLQLLIYLDESLVLFTLTNTVFTVVGLLMCFFLWFGLGLTHQ